MRNNFVKFYRVLHHDTTVTEVPAHDLKVTSLRVNEKGLPLHHEPERLVNEVYAQYSLLPVAERFYGYTSKVKAMEKAKQGALAYINGMLAEIEGGITRLKAYRSAHYDDLNTTLLDANIRKLEKEINLK
ncbi:hypothetical protein LLH06_03665 [Mucilaginibacter daejeonensis]|uniref:hypothetical protein n=1 Tax=Mucilaginibacter daejeonensis TaxID=398049 RepID=UPI001D1748AD|nr:hypothetical protein [Mucilaginibacter daejeonensis]UEG54067.1 hypothetical protein LLH06_03665 [Mucilaginibacter daejeonensis]